MRRAGSIFVCLLIIAQTSTVVVAAGESRSMDPQQAATTPTPSPTPTATAPALPLASDILARANVAIKDANTFRMATQVRIVLGNLLDGTVQSQGNVRLLPKASHLHLTGSLKVFGKREKLNEYTIQIGKKLWTKDAATHGRWAVATSGTSGISPTSNNPLKATSKGDKVVDITTIGSGTVESAAVWDVQGTYIAKIDSTHTATGTIDYFIGQSDSLPYEVKLHVANPQLNILENVDELSAAFAKKLTIRPPKVGSTSP